MILICMWGWTHDFNMYVGVDTYMWGGHMILICMLGWTHDFNMYVVDT